MKQKIKEYAAPVIGLLLFSAVYIFALTFVIANNLQG